MIHAVHSNNMSEMGGLRKHMPVTFCTFLIGTLALMGIPPFAGFFSKDEIIATRSTRELLVWIVAAGDRVLTAFYMTRMVLLDLLRRVPGRRRTRTSRRA